MAKRKDFFMMIDGVRTHVKRCKICGEVKKIEEYKIHKQNTRYGIKQYPQSYCKVCYSKHYSKHYFDGNPDEKFKKHYYQNAWKSHKIKYRGNEVFYHIYEELLEYQQHKCSICEVDDSFNRLAMDHDHKTGEVRGLLCQSCNQHAVGIYEKKGRYCSKWHTNIIKEYLSDPPINHIPTSVKHGWKYEMGVFPSPSEDNEMEEVAIQSPMDMWEEDE